MQDFGQFHPGLHETGCPQGRGYEAQPVRGGPNDVTRLARKKAPTLISVQDCNQDRDTTGRRRCSTVLEQATGRPDATLRMPPVADRLGQTYRQTLLEGTEQVVASAADLSEQVVGFILIPLLSQRILVGVEQPLRILMELRRESEDVPI